MPPGDYHLVDSANTNVRPEAPITSKWWKVALSLTLALLLFDSAARLRRVAALTASDSFAVPAATGDTAASRINTNGVVLGIHGSDAYQWILQTQQMVAQKNLRVRHVDFDAAPFGRETHWSMPLRLLGAGLSGVDSRVTGKSIHDVIERDAPLVSAVVLALLLVLGVPFVARHFGNLPATIVCAGAITIPALYSFFAVGDFDHHGLVTAAAMLTVLFLMAGGAGFVNERPSQSEGSTSPSLATARRLFIASGIAGGMGLWISAASVIPVLIGVGLSALVIPLVYRGNANRNAYEPSLWRLWGIAGATTSLVAYVIEYFPHDMSLRLEVNHPLLAVAWVAAGDWIARWHVLFLRSGASGKGDAIEQTAIRRHRLLMSLDTLLIAIPPAVVMLAPQVFVMRPGTLLFRLHQDYVDEVQGMASVLRHVSWDNLDIAFGVVAPVTALVLGIACMSIRNIAPRVRAMIIIALFPAIIFDLLAYAEIRWLGVASGVSLLVLIAVGVVADGASRKHAAVKRSVFPATALISFSCIGGLLLLALANHSQGDDRSQRVLEYFAQYLRPLAPLMVVSAGMLLTTSAFALLSALRSGWTMGQQCVFAAFAGMLFVSLPVRNALEAGIGGGISPVRSIDFAEVVTRDVAYRLRARLGSERGVVASGPTTTMWMSYFGGFRGLGTLAWENGQGLEDAARVFGASGTANETSADVALREIERLGVTHIVLFSWGNFATEYARLAMNVKRDEAAEHPEVASSFGPQLLRGELPAWLRPLAYSMPSIPGFEGQFAWVLEVVPHQTPSEAAVRLAQYADAMHDEAGALAGLTEVIHADSTQPSALGALARLQYQHPERGDFAGTIARLRRIDSNSLPFEDAVNLATVFSLAGDTTRALKLLTGALDTASERDVRRLPWGNATANLVLMIHQLGLTNRKPALLALAEGLLDPATRQNVESMLRANSAR